jgi:predicted nucleic acid-binding protein
MAATTSSPGASLLVDTDVLIDHLRGRREARDFLASKLTASAPVYCSTISRAEILGGMRPGEERAIGALLDALESVPIDEAVAEVGGMYRRRYGRSHGVLLPDALVAASARVVGATLVTCNVKHYPMSDLSKLRPY